MLPSFHTSHKWFHSSGQKTRGANEVEASLASSRCTAPCQPNHPSLHGKLSLCGSVYHIAAHTAEPTDSHDTAHVLFHLSPTPPLLTSVENTFHSRTALVG
ncbi:hypothetical protein DPEC_G00038250 [Dallia pectoralis]|uniref:Uncharacterized protein n=1 Tax=Dallia pectoralis TaxID=75939 RepID=A0ACC2HE31_DALPE|nr:hypothetical protein DPEC_G00038250 [Dallia pectoralis]